MNTGPTATTGTVCNPKLFQFSVVKKRQVAASLTGGGVPSDGGLPLLRQLDRRLGLTKATAQGSNPRFLVPNLTDDAQKLHDEVYCARGEMENRIKEQPLGLFADRTSCHAWWANQFRLLLSSFAQPRSKRSNSPRLNPVP